MMTRALVNILMILLGLACATIPIAALSDLAGYLRHRPTLGRDFWLSLLTGTTLVFLALIACVELGLLTFQVGP
jgi:hypothetical protein